MWGSRSITSTCVRIARNANACTRNTRAVNACAVRAYSSFGSYENPPNYETGEMDSQQPKKEKRPRAYARHIVRDKPSVLTQADRDKLEFRKKVREGKNLEQYNTTISEFIERDDSYEALVTLMDMYTNNVQPDSETFTVDIFLDMAPAEMKQDSLVFDRLVSELVKAKQYPLIGRLKFLADPDPLGRKQVAQVDITEMAVKWARYWFPEMGESEIQRVYGFKRSSLNSPAKEWESRNFGSPNKASSSVAQTESSESSEVDGSKTLEKSLLEEEEEALSTKEREKDEKGEKEEEKEEQKEGQEVRNVNPAVELKEKVAKAKLEKAEKKALERKQRIKDILAKNRNKNKEKAE